jgi:hypothetical protein
MIICTAGEPDLGRAELLHDLAWAAHDAASAEVLRLMEELDAAERRQSRSIELVDASAQNFADTCQAAGLTPVPARA